MRITCPRCEAAYEVPEMMLSAGLSAGRAVRCARCGERWVPLAAPLDAPVGASLGVPTPRTVETSADAGQEVAGPPSGPAEIPLPPEAVGVPEIGGAVLAKDTRPHQPGATRPSLGLRLAWLASVALVAAFLLIVLMLREDIASAWPPSLRLYRVLGLV